MKSITITFVPVEELAKSGEPSKSYPYQVGQPLPAVDEVVTFGDPFKTYKIKSRSFHYVDEETLQLFISIDG